jgi:hypothetical protein
MLLYPRSRMCHDPPVPLVPHRSPLDPLPLSRMKGGILIVLGLMILLGLLWIYK